MRTMNLINPCPAPGLSTAEMGKGDKNLSHFSPCPFSSLPWLALVPSGDSRVPRSLFFQRKDQISLSHLSRNYFESITAKIVVQ